MDHDHVPSKLQQLSIILEDFTKGTIIVTYVIKYLTLLLDR